MSVVVPTKDRPDALGNCLAALEAQTLLPRLEVVVVDDGSLAAGAVARVVERFPHAQLFGATVEGPAAARNAGARAAAGLFLCFTDDDCEPEPDWSRHLVSRLEAGADAVAGLTIGKGGVTAVASEIAAHAPAAVPVLGGHDLAFAPSNNLACTRETFAATPFDESFPDAAGEDREWCARLIANGRRLCLEPKARLVHNQELTLAPLSAPASTIWPGRLPVSPPRNRTSLRARRVLLAFAPARIRRRIDGGNSRLHRPDRDRGRLRERVAGEPRRRVGLGLSLGRRRGEERPRSEQPPPT